MQHSIELIEYTDPYCTWCWGSEPMIRRIEWVYGDQVRISFRMGGLVEDIGRFSDPLNSIGGDRWHEQVAAHWIDASRRHGMPVDASIFFELKDEFRSTYPASVAFKAAELQSESLAKIYLRRLREGAAAERKLIHREEVQAQLAEEVGLDRQRLLSDIRSGRAQASLLDDLKECRSRGISGFPTFLFRNRDSKEIVLHGYQRYEAFEKCFARLTADGLVPRNVHADESAVLAFIQKYRKVASQEVAETFSLSKQATLDWLRLLINKRLVVEHKVGNGSFYLA